MTATANKKWNVYEIVDGVWDITTTVSGNKPTAKKGQRVVPAPTQRINYSTTRHDPRLAFPAAHGLGIQDK